MEGRTMATILVELARLASLKGQLLRQQMSTVAQIQLEHIDSRIEMLGRKLVEREWR